MEGQRVFRWIPPLPLGDREGPRDGLLHWCSSENSWLRLRVTLLGEVETAGVSGIKTLVTWPKWHYFGLVVFFPRSLWHIFFSNVHVLMHRIRVNRSRCIIPINFGDFLVQKDHFNLYASWWSWPVSSELTNLQDRLPSFAWWHWAKLVWGHWGWRGEGPWKGTVQYPLSFTWIEYIN